MERTTFSVAGEWKQETRLPTANPFERGPPHTEGDRSHSLQAQESEGSVIPSLAGIHGAASGWGPSSTGSVEGRAVSPNRHGHRAPLPQQEVDIHRAGLFTIPGALTNAAAPQGERMPTPTRQQCAPPGERSGEVSVVRNRHARADT
ncbi:hypothetical protein NDU88_004565 [Pleurodeles waltl]|uniref:Uncharacterized protein n=1 Tax=Pleurodeles waltl TaxID=8319 RepID=A0AAV7QEY7_PLEWA|nr:hypothetical protein NDU88_004565 [Pleurodeles waltl]